MTGELRELSIRGQPALGVRALAFQAGRTVLRLVRHGATSGSLSCLVNYIYSFGNIGSGRSAAEQTNAEFLASIAGMATACYFTSLLVSSALAMSTLHHVRQPERRWGFKRMAARLLKRTIMFYAVTHMLTVATVYTIEASENRGMATYKMHLYLGGLELTICQAALYEACRTSFQRETAEGRAHGLAVTTAYWKRYLWSWWRTAPFAVVAILATGFVHVCSSLTLTTQLDLVIFSLASLALKVAILASAKYAVLQKSDVKLKTIYVATAAPTVIINTQVRLFLLRADLNWSLLGFLLLAVAEPVMRMSRTWSMRRKLRRREESMQSLHVHQATLGWTSTSVILAAPSGSSNTIRPVSGTEARVETTTKSPSLRLLLRSTSVRVNTSLDWTESLLHFNAAESHADMCSEYIAIACAMSIYYLFRTHPKFGWHNASLGGASDSSSNAWEVVLMGGYQVGMEFVVDMVCCMWELSRGIPLHDAEKLGSFLPAVFTSCSVISVTISAMLYVHEA